FFQAEDGIRDRNVTVVQTCALPIFAEFLAAGPPPVLITLGSVDVRTGGDSAVADFVRTTDRRVIVQGASGLVLAEAAPHRVFAADDVPHSWLLPQAAAAVHQAGAGITAACLRAGTPGLPIPQHTDQFYWAGRAHALGAAAAPLKGKSSTAAGIAAGVDQVIGDAGFARRAARIGARLEDGDSTAPLRGRARWLRARRMIARRLRAAVATQEGQAVRRG